MDQTQPLFAYFCSFHMTNIARILKMIKCVDGVLGTRTRCGRMVGAGKSTVLWWHPQECLRFNSKIRFALYLKNTTFSSVPTKYRSPCPPHPYPLLLRQHEPLVKCLKLKEIIFSKLEALHISLIIVVVVIGSARC